MNEEIEKLREDLREKVLNTYIDGFIDGAQTSKQDKIILAIFALLIGGFVAAMGVKPLTYDYDHTIGIYCTDSKLYASNIFSMFRCDNYTYNEVSLGDERGRTFWKYGIFTAMILYLLEDLRETNVVHNMEKQRINYEVSKYYYIDKKGKLKKRKN